MQHNALPHLARANVYENVKNHISMGRHNQHAAAVDCAEVMLMVALKMMTMMVMMMQVYEIVMMMMAGDDDD
jgi:hypothetical protein